MKKTFELFLSAKQEDWQTEPSFNVFQNEMQDYGYVTVSKFSIDVEIPDDFDIRQPMIDALEVQRKKAMADFEMLMAAIEGKIASLRCIEHKGVA